MDTNPDILKHTILEDDVFPPREFTAAEIDQYAIQFYAKKCEQYHEDPKAFAAFIFNVNGTMLLASFSSSPNDNTNRSKLTSSKHKDQIMHENPLVLARRGLIRFLMNEVRKIETNSESQILQTTDEGEIQMRTSCQLYMYSTFSYVCENVYWGMEEMKGHDTNHCIMNKIRRWVALGVQGALLSNIVNPIYIDKFVLGSTPPLPIDDVWRLLFSKMEFQDRDCPRLEAIPRPSPNVTHNRTFVWVAHLNRLDILGKTGKLELEGNGSSICKEEIFKAFLQLDSANKSILKYSRAKKRAGHYQALKKLLYKQWESENNGRWLRKKSNKVDKFWVQLRKEKMSWALIHIMSLIHTRRIMRPYETHQPTMDGDGSHMDGIWTRLETLLRRQMDPRCVMDARAMDPQWGICNDDPKERCRLVYRKM